VRSARALAVGSAVALAACFGVVIVCGKSYPDEATAAACGGFAVLVVLLAALRRVFGAGGQGAGGVPGGRFTEWQRPGGRGRS